MQTSLRGIANKARREKKHRFRNLTCLLTESNLYYCLKQLRKNAATGVDRVTFSEYERDFNQTVHELVKSLKNGSYRAKLVLRKWIPKGKDKLRPLGIPAMEDKLLQQAVSYILSSVFEGDFLKYSHGYRPNRGARQAVIGLQEEFYKGRYRYVVEADIKGFFDNIDHDWMVRMLEHRIEDKRFIRLIKKWLKAGILEKDGKVVHPASGTPQGGIVSPILANVYLHFVLDLWFEKVVKKQAKGMTHLCRYADDFICAFEYEADADRFYSMLAKRLNKFNLTLSEEKTRVLKFSRFPDSAGSSFDFLGFEYRWAESRKGKRIIKLRTSRKKLRQSVARFRDWCRTHRSVPIKRLLKTLNKKLRGYYNYYGVIGNYQSLNNFFRQALIIFKKWMNRRSQRKSFNNKRFYAMLKRNRIERPRITQIRTRQNRLQFSAS